jgi:HTH-type transcriptional regulator / antitoxin HigA
MSTATEYRDLLAKFVPRPIRTDDDYRRTLVQLGELMVPHPNAARSLLIEMPATLVERYESRDYPAPQVDVPDVLSHLIEAKGIKSADVAKATGIPAATISNVLARRRSISKQNAIKLGKYFGLSATTFLQVPESSPQVARKSRASKTGARSSKATSP